MDFNAIAAGCNLIAGAGCILAAILVWVRRRGIPTGYGSVAIFLGLLFFCGGVERLLLWYERAVGDIVNPTVTWAFILAVASRAIFAVMVWYIVYWIMRHDIHIIGGDMEREDLKSQVDRVEGKVDEISDAVRTGDKNIGQLTEDIHSSVVAPIIKEIDGVKDKVDGVEEELQESTEEIKKKVEDETED